VFHNGCFNSTDDDRSLEHVCCIPKITFVNSRPRKDPADLETVTDGPQPEVFQSSPLEIEDSIAAGTDQAQVSEEEPPELLAHISHNLGNAELVVPVAMLIGLLIGSRLGSCFWFRRGTSTLQRRVPLLST
jgi:hypothetical protein